ncbi:autotransporter outer membrane beta-barrel domain-containing protein [Pragia fontium]|uniref:Autotransporter family porin n=2 Tax=Pragia fontium TaxID=82985 RepID=A0AAJ4WAD2_9GAMM|nr:autotransporter outer membrane beta-barrel domain-containing protein [Pragia fontium]GKX62695.1 hypothetical protein SOASR032_12640 [Pragia fontium]SFC75358.1 autotransporter family porin [Pragia fontium DSM 5563 = ATCC 49100]
MDAFPRGLNQLKAGNQKMIMTIKPSAMALAIALSFTSNVALADDYLVEGADVQVDAGHPLAMPQGDTLIIGGDNTSGSLTVSEGGLIDNSSSDGIVSIGGWIFKDWTNSRGELHVTGQGSSLKTGTLMIGYTENSQGKLLISDGGQVSASTYGYIGGAGLGSRAEIIVSDTGSQLSVPLMLLSDRLTVQDGGSVNIKDMLSIGQFYANGSNDPISGRVVVTGSGSSLNAGFILMGVGEIDGDISTLTVADGGSVFAKRVSNLGLDLGHFNGDILLGLNDGSRGVLAIGAIAGDTAQKAGYVIADEIQLSNRQLNISGNTLENSEGQIVFNHTATEEERYTFTPRIVGDGTVDVYSGVTTLSAANSYTGMTSLYGGTLKAGGENTFSPAADYATYADSHLDLNGFNQTLSSLTHAGTLIFGEQPGTHLTISGNYVGNGGLLLMNGAINGDDSLTDKLTVIGDTSGNTRVRVTNLGGKGAQTIQGVELISVQGKSDGVFTQEGRIVAGAYDYTLVRGSGNNSANWYLTSEYVEPNIPPKEPDVSNNQPDAPSEKPILHNERPEAASYSANLAAANTLFNTSLHDRLGETQYIDALTGETRVTSMWLRQVGGHNRVRSNSRQLRTQSHRYVVQLGGDIAQWSSDGLNRLHLGLMAGYGNSQGDSYSKLSGYRSKNEVYGYSAGGYATWYANQQEKTGTYIDIWAQYSWFKNQVNGDALPSEKYNASGVTTSIESGYTFKVGEDRNAGKRYFIQPKAQIVWMNVEADRHTEANGTQMIGQGDGNVMTKLGFRAYMQGHNSIDDGKDREFEPFIETSWIHNSKQFGARMDGGATIEQQGDKNLAEVKLGIDGQLNKNMSLWTNVAQQVGQYGYSDTSLTLGLKYAF